MGEVIWVKEALLKDDAAQSDVVNDQWNDLSRKLYAIYTHYQTHSTSSPLPCWSEDVLWWHLLYSFLFVQLNSQQFSVYIECMPSRADIFAQLLFLMRSEVICRKAYLSSLSYLYPTLKGSPVCKPCNTLIVAKIENMSDNRRQSN